MVEKKEKFVFRKIGREWVFGRNGISEGSYKIAHIVFWISSFLFITALLASLHLDHNIWASNAKVSLYGLLIMMQVIFPGIASVISFFYVLLGIPKCEKLYEKVNIK